MITAWPAGCPVDRVLAVCSDHTVGGGGMRASDLAVPVSTDPEQVAKWLADSCGRVLVVGTYDSAHRLAAALRRAGQVSELTVCDEAHRLAGAAGKATAAILAVSYGGDSGEIEALRAVADKRGLTLLEDAAHAAGSRLDGRHMGTFGAAGAFSFYANKNLAIGEGGAVITDDAGMASRMRLLRSHGMSSVTWERHRRVGTYEALALGYNYRLDEPRAALARARLSRLDDENRERERLDQRYRELLSELDIGLCCGGEPRLEASRHLFAVVLPPRCNRDQARDELAKHGVQTSIHYPPVHTFRRYEEVETRLPLTEAYGSRTLTLPMFAAMTEAQQDLVVRALWESVSAG